jgi:hypothetical protein
LVLKALLVDAQSFINMNLAIEKLQKIAAREKAYEYWIYGICFNFVRFYKDRLSLEPGMGRAIPCDFSSLQIDYLAIAAECTVEHANRRGRHRPHGGRRRTAHISLPLRIHTVPSRR